MPRSLTILQSQFPYNISARCINKEWFNLTMDNVWTIFSEELCNTVEKYKIEIHSFVLMSNHFHLIASTPHANLSQAMQYFLSRSSCRLTYAGNRINQTFGGRYSKCILQSHTYYLNAYKYNYRNPVTAGICNAVEEYPYSTLRGIMGLSSQPVPILEDLTYKCDPLGTLAWLNEKPDPQKLEAVRYGFKRQYFRSKKHNKKLIMGENEIL